MQTAITTRYSTPSTIARLAAQTGTQARRHTMTRKFAGTWDMIGVLTVMSASAVYAASQLMTLAR